MRTLSEEYFHAIPGTPWGIRKIALDAARLRLFFLSLIWRTAASNLPEFEEVSLPQEQLERVRNMIVEGVAEPIEFLPISLTQLSTLGLIHNHGIIRETKFLPGLPGLPARAIPYLRIYLDGLIAHVALGGYSDREVAELVPNVLGITNEVILTTVNFENSFQRANLLHVNRETFT